MLPLICAEGLCGWCRCCFQLLPALSLFPSVAIVRSAALGSYYALRCLLAVNQPSHHQQIEALEGVFATSPFTYWNGHAIVQCLYFLALAHLASQRGYCNSCRFSVAATAFHATFRNSSVRAIASGLASHQLVGLDCVGSYVTSALTPIKLVYAAGSFSATRLSAAINPNPSCRLISSCEGSGALLTARCWMNCLANSFALMTPPVWWDFAAWNVCCDVSTLLKR